MKNQYRIFIDGEAGTTGLQIHQRLEQHEDITIVSIDPELRKNADEKSGSIWLLRGWEKIDQKI
jgi:N-acetyl-gamma-glutamyl-phosphate reductase